jgi:hypothetical protein
MEAARKGLVLAFKLDEGLSGICTGDSAGPTVSKRHSRSNISKRCSNTKNDVALLVCTMSALFHHPHSAIYRFSTPLQC